MKMNDIFIYVTQNVTHYLTPPIYLPSDSSTYMYKYMHILKKLHTHVYSLSDFCRIFEYRKSFKENIQEASFEGHMVEAGVWSNG